MVAGSLLAVGTVHVETLLVVAPIALLAAALSVFLEDRWSARFPAPFWVAAGLSLWSLLQSIPLPMRWLESLSKVAARTWQEARAVTGAAVSAPASLSMDPGASRVEALKWLVYAGAFLAAARLGRQRGCKPGALILVGSALLGGLLSLLHGLAGLDEWLGLYTPLHAHPLWAPTPLLNPNNFAGYLNLAIFTGLGLLLVRRPVLPRWLLGLGLAVLVALVVLTASRGGVAAMLFGFGILALILRSQQKRARRTGAMVLPAWAPLLAVSATALVLALLGSNAAIWQSLLDETTTKLRIIEYTRPLVHDSPWLGIGRGAFETVYPAYRGEAGHHIYQFAENFLAQWVVEWGLPVSLVAFGAFAWTLRPLRLGFGRHAIPTAAYIGFLALLLQNLVDLALEVTSVGLALFVLLGTLHGGVDYLQSKRTESRSRRALESGRGASFTASRPAALAAIALMGVGTALVGLVLLRGRPTAAADRRLLKDRLLATNPTDPRSVDAAKDQLRAAMTRHPADPYLPIIGAILARHSGQPPFAWLNQALLRDPKNARAHLLAADTLANRGSRGQALLELRLTAELEPGLVNTVARRALDLTQDFEQLRVAVPPGKGGIAMLNACARQLSNPKHRELKARLLEESFRRDPGDSDTNYILALDLLGQLKDKTSECASTRREECERRLRRFADTVERTKPDSLAWVTLHAMMLSYAGKLDEAERWLADRCPQLPQSTACAGQRLAAANALGSRERFELAATAYLAAACSNVEQCAAAAKRVGGLELGRDDVQAALSHFERSVRELPSADGWLKVADAALRAGRLGRAQSALRHAQKLGASEQISTLQQRLESSRRQQMLKDLDGP